MGQSFDETTPSLLNWIPQQEVFWVATAPLATDGHVWYEDLSGSGVETISHLRENRRITVLFNAFKGPPRIARLYGTGTVYEFGTLEYSTYIQESRSCGYGIPFYEFKALRTGLQNLLAKTEAPGAQLGLRQFWTTYNLKSIDGLTGLITAPFTSGAFQSTLKVYKADRKLKKTEHRFELGRVNLLVAFSMGLLAAALYVRLSQSITAP
ncbi:hypothetical protein B0H10DRAFT_1939806 [Mycena sp. CBHHK59/15]|nr:hypothetical protein B0H10DRAFT_1939806 [Mycena sp. CBHHK59/15]